MIKKNVIDNMSKCTGCKACKDVCPVDAISYDVDKFGYWYPTINNEKCISCGKCEKICPCSGAKDSDVKETFEKRAFAAWTKDDVVRKESTSGGLYYEFARYFIENNGYIVGSVYAEDYCSAIHIMSNTMEGLDRIKGSKYFQSDTEGIYIKTKEKLESGVKVLFTGTPCQIVALKSYLGKEYENLFTIDFICRGVPSPQLQKAKIKYYEQKEKSDVISYRDKSKYRSWSHFGELIKFSNGKTKFISRWLDDINNCFIEKNLNLRESCYLCEIKSGKNKSDITIGDFWGIGGVTNKDYDLGVSALIVNSNKGMSFLNVVKDRLYVQRRDLEEISAGNPAYVSAPTKPEARDDFFECVHNNGIHYAVKKFTSYDWRRRIRNYIIAIKSWLITVAPRFDYPKELDWAKFIKYNYFCKQVHRNGNYYIFPYKGTVMSIAEDADIQLNGDILINYYPCYKRGNNMAQFKVADGAKLVVNNRLELAYQTTFSLGRNAYVECGLLYTGVGANIISNFKMIFGNNIMLGRDVCIFDSDYHDIFDESHHKINNDVEVQVQDNVWIGARSMVLKGTVINEGAIISANSLIMGCIESNRVYINKRESRSIGNTINWKR